MSAIRLGDLAPNFQGETTTDGNIDFHTWIGSHWVLFCSHPADYTPVCTTEIGELQKLKPELDRRNVKAIVLSVDSLADHAGWAKDVEETQGVSMVYPLLADPDRKIAAAYGMLNNTETTAAGLPMTVRSVFVIDPSKKIRLVMTYPASCGRNFNEILRCIDSLQLTDKYAVATPVNWTDGGDCVIVPTVSSEAAKDKFPKGFTEVKKYLRITPQPNK